MRYAAVVGIVGLALTCLPGSAQADRSEAIAGVASLGAVAAIACWTTALAGAEDEKPEGEYSRRGWLAGVSGRYAAVAFKDDVESTVRTDIGKTLNFSLKNSFGLVGQAGYRCHERVSAEIEVEWLDGFDGSAFRAADGKFREVDFEPVAVTANAKGYLLTGRIQPFLLLGGGLLTVKRTEKFIAAGTSASDTTTDFAMRFGGGIDIYTSRNIVLTWDIDYLLPFGSNEDLDYVSTGLGLQYRF